MPPNSFSSKSWDAISPPLSPWVREAVMSMGFQRMTPVQASTIPLFIGNKDVVVEAVTGSGKTLAFLIPLVERLVRMEDPIKKNHIFSIIISPTRELAGQIYNVLSSLLAFHEPPSNPQNGNDTKPSGQRLVPFLVTGGQHSPSEDLRQFLQISPNVLIATPGRLLDLLSSPHVHCPESSFEVLILDEADRLLDLGFKDDLQKIFRHLPKQRRTGLFSASMNDALDQIVRVGLRNPVKVSVKVKNAQDQKDQRTPASLNMRYLVTPASHKLPALLKILDSIEPAPAKTIVYMATCASVDYFQHVLPRELSQLTRKFTLVPLHGKHQPKVRAKNFARFNEAMSSAILLTTDVAARGLDISQVDLVVQVDPPSDPKVFLHRCGRAGRAGRKGLAIAFLQPGREEDYLGFLEVRQTPVKPLESPKVSVSEGEAAECAERMRRTVLEDRALHDKAQRGFVSWVQSYSKHHASSIFRVSDLDWADLGKQWALLKLPKMPELKGWTGDPSLGLDIDLSTIAYKDKVREQQRIDSLGTLKPVSANGHHDKLRKRSWGDTLDKKARKETKRSQKSARRERQRLEDMTPSEREEQKKLESLVAEVKRRNIQERETFEGFED